MNAAAADDDDETNQYDENDDDDDEEEEDNIKPYGNRSLAWTKRYRRLTIRTTSAELAFCDSATDRRRIGTRRYPVVSWASVSYAIQVLARRDLDAAALADRA